MAHFEIKNLSFSYPTAGDRKALDDINLTIERGQYVTFCVRMEKTEILKVRNGKTQNKKTEEFADETDDRKIGRASCRERV